MPRKFLSVLILTALLATSPLSANQKRTYKIGGCALALFGAGFLALSLLNPPKAPSLQHLAPEPGATPDTTLLYEKIPDPGQILLFAPNKVTFKNKQEFRDLQNYPESFFVRMERVDRIREENLEDPELHPDPPFLRIQIEGKFEKRVLREGFEIPLQRGLRSENPK